MIQFVYDYDVLLYPLLNILLLLNKFKIQSQDLKNKHNKPTIFEKYQNQKVKNIKFINNDTIFNKFQFLQVYHRSFAPVDR